MSMRLCGPADKRHNNMPERNKPVIMVVDDNQVSLTIARNMLKAQYKVYALPSAAQLLELLETVTPALILLDIEMPGMSGFDVVNILKADSRHADIPVIFLTAMSEEMNELEGLSLGAVDYVTKPFSAAILRKRIENHLLIEEQKAALQKHADSLVGIVKKKTAQVSGLQNSIIKILAELVEFRDVFTGEHISRTQKYMELLINRMVEDGLHTEDVLSWGDMDAIISSTQLHDLGKIFISDAILNKPGRLTAEEFDIMKTHAAKGVEALRRLEKDEDVLFFLQHAEAIIGTHHEKWDGSGYPAGLKGEGIPLLGRLMAIADVYDALTSERPYKKPFTTEEAGKIIIEGAGKHFDPKLVGVFRKVAGEFAAIASNNGGDAA